MTRELMNRQIQEELRHIPKGGLNQGLLRSSYQIRRQRSLSANAPARKAAKQDLQEAMAAIREKDSTATFEYDASFFV